MPARRFLAVLLVCLSLPVTARSAGAVHLRAPDPEGAAYTVSMLDRFATRYRARVAGADTDLPPSVNGHDEFAADWVSRMRASLHGLPVQVAYQSFATPGFSTVAAVRPGRNVIVLVPGSRQPDQAMVVGSHYDGEPFSQGSAYDDTSGSAIILGLARTMGAEWRSHGLPARTVEFVLFDGEEQGLIGSAAYTFFLGHGAIMPRPVFMLNEEQSGIGYPVRPFGLASGSDLPTYGITTGPQSKAARFLLGAARSAPAASLNLALTRLRRAGDASFRALHVEYPQIAYRGGSATAFTSKDRHLFQTGPNLSICCSDNDPFEALGLPTVTLAGNANYYDRDHPSWAYPFDQPQDTPTALACDTGGSPVPGAALRAALALELRVSTQLIADYAPAGGTARVSAFSDQPAVGHTTAFVALGGGAATWAFGDGTHARGDAVSHIYRRAGTFHVTVSQGSTTRTWRLSVPTNAVAFVSRVRDLRPPPVIPWHPPELASVTGCNQP